MGTPSKMYLCVLYTLIHIISAKPSGNNKILGKLINKQRANNRLINRKNRQTTMTAYETLAEEWENTNGEEVFGQNRMSHCANTPVRLGKHNGSKRFIRLKCRKNNQKTVNLFIKLYYQQCNDCRRKFKNWVTKYGHMSSEEREAL